MKTTPSHDAGFSLMETLVALFVVALLSTAGGSLLLSTINSANRIEVLMEDIRTFEVASAFLRDDLAAMTERSSAPPSNFTAPTGPTGSDGERDGTVLSFVRGGWARHGTSAELRSDLLRIEYLREDAQLIRRIYTSPDPGPQTPFSERVVLSGLERLEIRYLDDDQWFSALVTTDTDLGANLVDVVEISFHFTDERMLTQRFLAGGAGK